MTVIGARHFGSDVSTRPTSGAASASGSSVLTNGARGDHYDLRGYVDGFADALAAADLVLARSGGSIFEVAAAGKPAILVPYPHAAGDHQAGNARWMADAGAAVILRDAELTADRLSREVTALLGSRERLAAMARASAALARPDAARAIANEVVAAGNGRQER